MAKAEAYSEKHGRNISLDEAHQLYFSQTGKKERFVFRCGDSLCRSKLNPLVSAALYDRNDIPGEMSYTPYFRSLNNHPHIEKCTWLELIKSINNSSKAKNASLSSWSVSQKGLIFDPFPSKNNSPGIAEPNNHQHSSSGERPQSSRFMQVVANRYLGYSEDQRKSITLKIGKIASNTFYKVCRPLFTFHPYYQSKTIYFGLVEVIQLSHAFLITFNKKMSPQGTKDERNVEGQITLNKAKLEKEDLPLLESLINMQRYKGKRWCFFYSNIPPTTKTIGTTLVARFEISSFNHIAVISESGTTPISKS